MTTKRLVVGAHYGLRDWLAQRITAVILTVYSLVLLICVLAMPALTYGNWAGLFGNPWIKVLTLLAVLSLIYHAWIGVRDIWMDYVKATGLRLFLEVLTIIALIGYGCWAATILWRV